MNLGQRVALVTGSTSGIGAEIARRLGEAEARVVVTGRDGDRGQEIVGEITGAGGEACFITHDLEDVNGSYRLLEETVEVFGRIDILVNNGGTLMAAPTPEVDADTFDWAFRLNVRSAFCLRGRRRLGWCSKVGGV
jgi:NAD(P)-dependent dehydrogenase (short-subunit alcohol dehydrogenase family)